MLSYQVVLNSLNGAGANIALKTYLFDWSVFQDGKYSVSFSYASKFDQFNGTKIPLLFCQLGGSKVFTTNGSIQAQPFNFLGTLRLGDNPDHNLNADLSTNAPIYLDSRPYSQEFSVAVQDETGALYTDTGGNDILGYVITLCFTKME